MSHPSTLIFYHTYFLKWSIIICKLKNSNFTINQNNFKWVMLSSILYLHDRSIFLCRYELFWYDLSRLWLSYTNDHKVWNDQNLRYSNLNLWLLLGYCCQHFWIGYLNLLGVVYLFPVAQPWFSLYK